MRCYVFLIGLLVLPACAANEAVPRGEILEPPIVQLQSDDPDAEFPIDIHDPWEGWNRQVYLFNARFRWSKAIVSWCRTRCATASTTSSPTSIT
jgi:hypothetical protein